MNVPCWSQARIPLPRHRKLGFTIEKQGSAFIVNGFRQPNSSTPPAAFGHVALGDVLIGVAGVPLQPTNTTEARRAVRYRIGGALAHTCVLPTRCRARRCIDHLSMAAQMVLRLVKDEIHRTRTGDAVRLQLQSSTYSDRARSCPVCTRRSWLAKAKPPVMVKCEGCDTLVEINR